jgi:hypothetical protein
LIFINKAIEKTKTGDLQWFRLKDFDPDYQQWDADANTSFAANINKESEIYLFDRDSEISMAIYPGFGLSTQYFADSNDIKTAFIRLYNLVYNKFPNVDSILDDFINS